MTQAKFNKIISLHKRWLDNNEDGVCANLSGTDLREIDFSKVIDLSGANLSQVDLSGMDLSGIRLCKANLTDACLVETRFNGANLSDTNLSQANLYETKFNRANLCRANLCRADMFGANFSKANLKEAVLEGANLMNTIGDIRYIKNILVDKYHITYTYDTLQIGCQKHKIEKWKNFSNSEIFGMDSKALEWWTKWKSTIMEIIEMSPAER